VGLHPQPANHRSIQRKKKALTGNHKEIYLTIITRPQSSEINIAVFTTVVHPVDNTADGKRVKQVDANLTSDQMNRISLNQKYLS